MFFVIIFCCLVTVSGLVPNENCILNAKLDICAKFYPSSMTECVKKMKPTYDKLKLEICGEDETQCFELRNICSDYRFVAVFLPGFPQDEEFEFSCRTSHFIIAGVGSACFLSIAFSFFMAGAFFRQGRRNSSYQRLEEEGEVSFDSISREGSPIVGRGFGRRNNSTRYRPVDPDHPQASKKREREMKNMKKEEKETTKEEERQGEKETKNEEKPKEDEKNKSKREKDEKKKETERKKEEKKREEERVKEEKEEKKRDEERKKEEKKREEEQKKEEKKREKETFFGWFQRNKQTKREKELLFKEEDDDETCESETETEAERETERKKQKVESEKSKTTPERETERKKQKVESEKSKNSKQGEKKEQWSEINLKTKDSRDLLGEELHGYREHVSSSKVIDQLKRPNQSRTPPPFEPYGANGSNESLREELEAAEQKAKEDLFRAMNEPESYFL